MWRQEGWAERLLSQWADKDVPHCLAGRSVQSPTQLGAGRLVQLSFKMWIIYI